MAPAREIQGEQKVAVKIRLKRMGAKKRPFYRVVVADARSPRDGRFIESVGYYDPLRDPKVVKLDDERIRHWMSTGAKPSDAVRELMEREGLLPKTPRPVRASKAAPVATAQAVEVAAPVEAVEAPEPVVAVEEEGATDSSEPAPSDSAGTDPDSVPDESDLSAPAEG